MILLQEVLTVALQERKKVTLYKSSGTFTRDALCLISLLL